MGNRVRKGRGKAFAQRCLTIFPLYFDNKSLFCEVWPICSDDGRALHNGAVLTGAVFTEPMLTGATLARRDR